VSQLSVLHPSRSTIGTTLSVPATARVGPQVRDRLPKCARGNADAPATMRSSPARCPRLVRRFNSFSPKALPYYPSWGGKNAWVALGVVALVIAAILETSKERFIIQPLSFRIEIVNNEFLNKLRYPFLGGVRNKVKVANFSREIPLDEWRGLQRINFSFCNLTSWKGQYLMGRNNQLCDTFFSLR